MARDRTPTNLKLITGKEGRNPVESVPGKSATGKPTPPPHLKGEAFSEWCRVTGYLESVGKIEQIDYAALIVYCISWKTYVDAMDAMELHGPLIEGRDGGLVKNPAAQIMRDASDTMLKYGARFGFTPKDRQNMGITSAPAAGDDLDDLMGGVG